MTETIQLGQTRITIGKGWTKTEFADGSELVAMHDSQPGQEDTAERTGYRTVEAMNRDHDLTHSLLAHIAGLPWSPTLHDVATGKATNIYEHYIEEQAVLSFQTFTNLLGISIADIAKRLGQ